VTEVPYDTTIQSGHKLIIENFANAILHGEALISPATDGHQPGDAGELDSAVVVRAPNDGFAGWTGRLMRSICIRWSRVYV